MQNHPPEDGKSTGRPNVLLIVACVGIVLWILGVAAIFMAWTSASSAEQQNREQAADVLKPGVRKVSILNAEGIHPIELLGEEARLFGTIGQKELAREVNSDSGWMNYNFKELSVEYTCADGSTLTLDMDGQGAYYLVKFDTWYLGSRHHAFFVRLVYVTFNLERGVDPMLNNLGREHVESAFDYMYIPQPTPWQGLEADEQAFVKSWVDRYNKVSGHEPLSVSKLFPAK